MVTWRAFETGVYFFRLFLFHFKHNEFREKLGLVSIMCFFRATFVKTHDIFWLYKDVPNTTPATTAIITSGMSI